MNPAQVIFAFWIIPGIVMIMGFILTRYVKPEVILGRIEELEDRIKENIAEVRRMLEKT